jgi:hypothetical protein
MVRQVNIQMMTLIRRSHLIVASPVAAAGAAWAWCITDAGRHTSHTIHGDPKLGVGGRCVVDYRLLSC